jgi:hypothetical protein
MLKNLKSLFIVSEEESTTDNTTAKVNEQKVEENTTKSSETTIQKPQQSPNMQIDAAILDKLLNAMEMNNQSGFDYIEYRRALKSLESLPMDEATKFRSSYATASTMGVTPEKLIASIAFYKKVLQSEESKFKKTIDEQLSVNVDQKLKEKAGLQKLIEEKSQMIAKLTEEIRQHQGQMSELDTFVDGAKEKIHLTANNFDNAYNNLMGQIENDESKIKEYLK